MDIQSIIETVNKIREKHGHGDGGPGSGNWGHAGRPGQMGGSGDGGESILANESSAKKVSTSGFEKYTKSSNGNFGHSGLANKYGESEKSNSGYKPVHLNSGKTNSVDIGKGNLGHTGNGWKMNGKNEQERWLENQEKMPGGNGDKTFVRMHEKKPEWSIKK